MVVMSSSSDGSLSKLGLLRGWTLDWFSDLTESEIFGEERGLVRVPQGRALPLEDSLPKSEMGRMGLRVGGLVVAVKSTGVKSSGSTTTYNAGVAVTCALLLLDLMLVVPATRSSSKARALELKRGRGS